MSTESEFMLCDFLNEKGRRVERIYIVEGEGDPAEKARAMLQGTNLERVMDRLFAKAKETDEITTPADGALAVHALLHDVIEERISVETAREIRLVSVNFRHAVEIADVIPALETSFGGHAVSWARGVFSHLDLGPAGVN